MNRYTIVVDVVADDSFETWAADFAKRNDVEVVQVYEGPHTQVAITGTEANVRSALLEYADGDDEDAKFLFDTYAELKTVRHYALDFDVVSSFATVDQTNAFLIFNSDCGVLGDFDGRIVVARLNDLGTKPGVVK